MTVQATAVPLYRTLDLRKGRRVEFVDGKKRYILTTDDGRAVVGPIARRRGKMKQKPAEVPPAPVPEWASALGESLSKAFPPSPPPRRPNMWSRLKEALTDLHAHEVAQAWAKTMLLWAITLGGTAVIAKAVIWTWS